MIEKEFKIEFPIFSYNFNIVHTTDIAKSRSKRDNILGSCTEALDHYVDGLHSYHDQEPDCHIFLTKDTSEGVVAHEVFHAIWRMFKYLGAKMENEVFAYHLSYTLDKINEWKKTI